MASDSDSDSEHPQVRPRLDSETPFAARQISSNAQTDDARNEPSRSLLTEVLKKLPHHNLEDRIVCSSNPAPSFGGYSDIYYGFFKADILRDSLTSPHCLICRVKVALRTQACHRCRVIWDESSKLAVKKIRVHVRDRNHVKAIARELYIFSKLSHPNVIPFIGYLLENDFPTIVTPWVKKGSLLNHIQTGQMSFLKENILRMARGIAEGLAYLHEKDILHCDLKSDNILLSSTEEPLLADFGLSRMASGNNSVAISHSAAGPSTMRWSAPELYGDNALFTQETDVWGYGMVLYEIVTHKFPYFDQVSIPQVVFKIISGDLPLWSEEGSVDAVECRTTMMVRDLCNKCWSKVPSERPTMRVICTQLVPAASKLSDSDSAGKNAFGVGQRNYKLKEDNDDVAEVEAREKKHYEKPLPSIPPEELDASSFQVGPPSAIDQCLDVPKTSAVSTLPATILRVSKRQHALNELLSSETVYASELVFIRDVCIPLALGDVTPLHYPPPATPPSSPESSTRAVSNGSDFSPSSNLEPPMTTKDVRMIFSNVGELALLSEELSERLKDALGDVLHGGEGEDRVGELFLEIIPKMELFYRAYIIRHPMALQHLRSLPKNPALNAYFARTQSMASSITHSWDLPSLLIKPVQQLLNYPLLLGAIIEQTPDSHGDKENLKSAMEKMEGVVRGINEGRKRIEIMKEVLAGRTDTGNASGVKKKMSTNKSAFVILERMKSISVGMRIHRPKEDDEAVAKVEAYEKKLRDWDPFVREFARDIVGWAACVKKSIEHLREWAICFARTIGISDGTPSEAFSAFLDVLDMRLSPLCDELVDVVEKELLPQLARLLDTSKSPLRLLTAMHSLEAPHFSLLNLHYSKSRPPPALIEASQNYLALRSQLNSELPAYLKLFDAGVVRCIRLFARRQTEFWVTVRDQWAKLWNCLRMEGETNAGCEETLRLWWNRYSEVDERVGKLSLLRRVETSMSWLMPLPMSPIASSSRLGSTRRRTSSVESMNVFSMHYASHRSPRTESLPTADLRSKSRAQTPESSNRRSTQSNPLSLPATPSSPTPNYCMYTSASYSQRWLSGEQSDSSDTRSTNDAQGRNSRSSSFSGRPSQSLPALLRKSPSHKSIASTASWKTQASASSSHMPTTLTEWPTTRKHPVVVVYPFGLRDIVYRDRPFFQLQLDEIYEVLGDAGHPSTCEGLLLQVEDMSDRLLLVRNIYREIGWALASFVTPIC